MGSLSRAPPPQATQLSILYGIISTGASLRATCLRQHLREIDEKVKEREEIKAQHLD